MQTFTTKNNNTVLTINIDDDHILNKINARINKYENYLSVNTPESTSPEYDLHVVDSKSKEICSVEDIISDCNEFKKIINNAIENKCTDLWSIITTKKNGTFNRSCKCTVKTAINCKIIKFNSWKQVPVQIAYVLRLVPISETLVELKFQEITLPY